VDKPIGLNWLITPYSGTRSATLQVGTTTANMDGDLFRCVLENAIGSVTSRPAV
jgi:hypothetical protein